jgi:dTDP-4-dehydrorhamnose 3,5-epimerase-like enzyme
MYHEDRVPGLGSLSVPDDDIRLVSLPRIDQRRGTLLPFDFEALPFNPRRVFVVKGVPPGTVRGRHAHRRGQQLLVRLTGEIRVELRRGGNSKTIPLTSSDVGLLIPAGVWAAQTYVTPDSVLLVLCSEPYDAATYVSGRVA